MAMKWLHQEKKIKKRMGDQLEMGRIPPSSLFNSKTLSFVEQLPRLFNKL